MSKKNCPFCGGDKVEATSVYMSKGKQMMYAKCPDCKTNFRVSVGVYNTRPLEDALQAKLDEARVALKFYADGWNGPLLAQSALEKIGEA